MKATLGILLRVLRKPNGTFIEQYGCLHNLRSATKSIMSILLGIAINHHFINSIDDEVYKYLPSEYLDNLDTQKKRITIRHVITMKSGLGSIEGGIDAIKMLFSDGDWVNYILSLPMKSKPGEKFSYNSANTHLLSAIISHATQMNVLSFAKKYLFEPLGVTNMIWETDSKGYHFGGGNLFLSPHDMAKIGYLILKNGYWGDEEIVSENWLKQSLNRYYDWDYGFKYGFLWYIKDEISQEKGYDCITYSAAGSGGQRIFIIPELDIVISATSRSSLTEDKGYVLNEIIGKFIL